jgi:hypothetical protein
MDPHRPAMVMQLRQPVAALVVLIVHHVKPHLVGHVQGTAARRGKAAYCRATTICIVGGEVLFVFNRPCAVVTYRVPFCGIRIPWLLLLAVSILRLG